LLRTTDRLAEAEPLCRRALAIDEQSYGAEHSNVAHDLNNLAQLLQDTSRVAEVEPIYRRALAIDESVYGPEHHNVARDLNNLATLLTETNRLAEAEPLYRRALAIDERTYGTKHPNVARDLNNLAQLLQDTNRLAEAEPLLRRALAVDENIYGPEHPDVARDVNNLALLLKATNRLAEAAPLMRRVVEIFLKFTSRTGHRHPHLHEALGNYGGLLHAMGSSQSEVEQCISDLQAEYSFGWRTNLFAGGETPTPDHRQPLRSTGVALQERVAVPSAFPGMDFYEVYYAQDGAVAMAFLSAITVTRKQYYVVVETPEGIFGKDQMGSYVPSALWRGPLYEWNARKVDVVEAKSVLQTAMNQVSQSNYKEATRTVQRLVDFPDVAPIVHTIAQAALSDVTQLDAEAMLDCLSSYSNFLTRDRTGTLPGRVSFGT
jgi:tetratricopeptide (TPR) repeat protein